MARSGTGETNGTRNTGWRVLRGAVPAALLVASLCGCDKKSAEGERGAEPASASSSSADEALEKASEDKAAATLFDPEDKQLRKRACEFLTPEMVAGQFDVPAADLKQTKIMGCIYSWSGDDETLNAQLMLIQVHNTEEAAKRWFDNATASRTKEEIDAQIDTVKKKAQDHEKIDTSTKKKITADLTDAVKLGISDEGVSYDDVDGIGDQARMSDSDGSVYVRLGNMTFTLAAYKGPDKPTPPLNVKDPKAMMAQAIELQNQWIQETLEKRREAAKKLAPLVIEAIRES